MGFVEELIELIKNNEIIYNKKCGGYKNIARKAEIWENISKTLNQPGKKINLFMRLKVLKFNKFSFRMHEQVEKCER